MPEREPEWITIVEGPTPEFRPSPYLWFQSLLEGPEDAEAAMCELRSLNGAAIQARCLQAWADGRAVRLDYPDDLRARQHRDVLALRLQELDEGPLLTLWVRQPAGELEEESDEGSDDFGL
ncbi:MAG: hypothetical protein ACRDHL_04650 [Candidatus Promineifilaceae bacterium]